MIRYISIMSARIQNQIIYGTKLIANSAMKLSREKYRNEIATTDIRKRNNIQSYYLFKYLIFLNFCVFFSILIDVIIA